MDMKALARQLAIERYHCEGVVEVDEGAPVSLSDDGDGVQWAYVQAWVYVEFGEGD